MTETPNGQRLVPGTEDSDDYPDYDVEHTGTALPAGDDFEDEDTPGYYTFSAEREPVIPLLREALARVDQDVVLYLPGVGISGKLVQVDSGSLVLTVVDNRRRYDIALASVAVIEGSA